VGGGRGTKIESGGEGLKFGIVMNAGEYSPERIFC